MQFRVRSGVRDEGADARRLKSVERSVVAAITEAETEKAGLERRLEAARAHASALVGTEEFEYVDRDPKKEQLLANAEQQLLAADMRIRQLATHVGHLRQVLILVKRS